jgi:hypothetical protein
VNLVSRLLDSLLARVVQLFSVELLKHADAVCAQVRARRDLETLGLADDLEAKGAREMADSLRSRVQAEDALRLPALNVEVEQLLMPIETDPPVSGNSNGTPARPLALPQARRASRPARTSSPPENTLSTSPPSQGKD